MVCVKPAYSHRESIVLAIHELVNFLLLNHSNEQ